MTYAEELNYWKSSTIPADSWLEKIEAMIEGVGGSITGQAFGVTEGRSAFMLSFSLGNEAFKLIWPVLEARNGDKKAAKIQAATMLYHDVKAKCVSAQVLGARAAFAGSLLLPDGRTVAEAAAPDIALMLPSMILLPAPKR